MQVKRQQLETDIEQQIGSKLEKEYVKAVSCHPAYLTYIQSISCEMLGWMKHKLESRLPGEISIICISEVIGISLGNLDSSLWFLQPRVSHNALCI